MTEQKQELPKRRTRRRIVVVTLFACFSLIGWIVAEGDPTNSLHESAMAWAFWMSMFVIGGFIFDSKIADGVLKLKGNK